MSLVEKLRREIFRLARPAKFWGPWISKLVLVINTVTPSENVVEASDNTVPSTVIVESIISIECVPTVAATPTFDAAPTYLAIHGQ